MEAVPRLHMLWFALKTSPEGTSFANLKKYIAECYQEDPEAYSKDVHALEMLRNSSMRPAKDMQGCATLKRYYCQLHSLTNRFPQISDRSVFTFTWKDLYQNNVHEVTDLRFEMAAVLFNIAASHTQVGASVSRGDVDGMKLACTHFQCAAWAFGELREKYSGVNSNSDFMTPELLLFMQQVSLAQAQECILEKSLIDNRKPNIVAKVTAQIVTYYGAALAALMTGGDDGPIGQVIDSSVYKLWKKYVMFKISYLTCILFLYQGQHSEEQQKMGERVTLYQAAWDKLEEARKESKGLPDQKEIIESLTFTADVVEGKRKNAKNENEFIYHESVPELSDISAVQGANLVNGIAFSVTDPDVAGEDIFGRLVPMKAHEASSLYSEEKAKILREIGSKIEKNDLELASYMSSLTLDNLNVSEEKANKIPQGIVDRCASLNANKAAIPDLIASMSHLAEICAEVETNLNEIKAILNEEETKEKQFQQNSGVHRSNGHLTELTREFQKYSEAHQKAGESNDTLRKAMELHVNNLKILSKPLQEIQSSVPKLSAEFNSAEVFKDLKLILNKVNEMKAQRAQFHADLRIAVNNDDITTKVIAHGTDEGLQTLFEKELKKHDKQIQLIEANLSAQTNILSALTEAYAKAAPVLKTLSDVKHKKDNFFSSLAASFDVYEDLLGKSAKGLEFYKKLSGNVQKLLARVRAAKDVQDEDREQRIKSVAAATPVPPMATPTVPSSASAIKSSSTPKLKDYLKGKAAAGDSGSTYIPSIRPNPLGSENPTAATCGTAPPAANQSYSQAVGPNEPPPPYSVNQYYDPSGYSNPIYQNTPAPPYDSQSYYQQGYTSSQTAAMGYEQPLATQMENMAIQPQEYNYGYHAPTQMPQRSQTYPQYSTASQASGQTTPATQSYPQYSTGAPASAHPTPAGQSYPQYSTASQAGAQAAGQSYAQYATASQAGASAGQSYPQYSTAPPASVQATPAAQIYPQYSAATQASAQATPAASLQSYPSSYTNTSQSQPQQPPVPQNPLLYSPYVQQPPQPEMTPPPSSVPQSSPAFAYQTLGQTGADTTPQSHLYQSPLPNTYPTPYTAETFQSPAYGAEIQQYPSNQPTPTPAPVQDSMQGLVYGGMGMDVQNGGTTSSYATHPGYSFNAQSGTYEYGSGYQTMQTSAFYGQYTTPVGQTGQMSSVTTGSGNTSKISTQDQDLPVMSHTKQQDAPPTDADNLSYFTLPYGYQSNGTTSVHPVGYSPPDLTHSTPMYTPSQTTIYMQSGQTNPTQTTASEEYAPSSAPAATPQSNLATPQPAPQPSPQPTAQATPPRPTPQPQPRQTKKPASNIDLLTDIDFSIGGAPPILPAPALQPQIAPTTTKSEAPPEPLSPSKQAPAAVPAAPVSPVAPLESPTKRKMSCDNLSIGSDLSSLDHNFDWDNVSVRSDGGTGAKSSPPPGGSFPSKSTADPFADAKTLKYFHKEVERFEKTIETLNVQMLNGSTPLKSKWKELNDMLTKDSPKRTTAIAKLFPEKNRSIDCIPYDHSRVVLETSTDDYINAAYVKDLGPGCPNFIIAQTPQQNTLNDFWSMIWSQKARTVVCLHTPNEILDPFWPQEVNTEMHFDDFSVRAVKQNQLSHCTEMNLKLSMNGADAILDLSLIQIKAWTKSSPTQILGIAQNALMGHKQRCQEFKTNSPLIMNCLTGSERSEQIAVAICAILATQAKRPLLINVVDVWYRICSQRQNALKDPANLELSMQIVLSHAHDVLNKRGIMTSYQMKTAQTVTAKEKEEIKDPLNELDPLWKLKQK